MPASPSVDAVGEAARDSRTQAPAHSPLAALSGGGTDGNEQLTATVGVTLIVLLAVIGVTILRIGQLISVHLFVGFVLIGPVALKMGSTGYRFARYYTREPHYHAKGPPHSVLRAVAPVVVITTVLVFVSGVLLMFAGPDHRNPLLEIHKVSFIAWIVFTALHVLGHLPGLGHGLRATRLPAGMTGPAPGSAGRWLALSGVLVAGLVLAIVLIPYYSPWTTPGGMRHH